MTVTQAVQQTVHRAEFEQHTELLLQNALNVLAVEGAGLILGSRARVQTLAKRGFLLGPQAGLAAAAGTFLESLGSALVVAFDPMLHRTHAAVQDEEHPAGNAHKEEDVIRCGRACFSAPCSCR